MVGANSAERSRDRAIKRSELREVFVVTRATDRYLGWLIRFGRTHLVEVNIDADLYGPQIFWEI